jgi:hypothetical protein
MQTEGKLLIEKTAEISTKIKDDFKDILHFSQQSLVIKIIGKLNDETFSKVKEESLYLF